MTILYLINIGHSTFFQLNRRQFSGNQFIFDMYFNTQKRKFPPSPPPIYRTLTALANSAPTGCARSGVNGPLTWGRSVSRLISITSSYGAPSSAHRFSLKEFAAEAMPDRSVACHQTWQPSTIGCVRQRACAVNIMSPSLPRSHKTSHQLNTTEQKKHTHTHTEKKNETKFNNNMTVPQGSPACESCRGRWST